MDKQNEIIDRDVKRLFGPGATIDGRMGSAIGTGDIRIVVDGRTIGTGTTFAAALTDAQRCAGRELTGHGDTLVPSAFGAPESIQGQIA